MEDCVINQDVHSPFNDDGIVLICVTMWIHKVFCREIV